MTLYIVFKVDKSLISFKVSSLFQIQQVFKYLTLSVNCIYTDLPTFCTIYSLAQHFKIKHCTLLYPTPCSTKVQGYQ